MSLCNFIYRQDGFLHGSFPKLTTLKHPCPLFTTAQAPGTPFSRLHLTEQLKILTAARQIFGTP